jgi:type IV secretory pathway VirB4 component
MVEAVELMLMFNRGGESWTYDRIRDRTKNGHLLMLGETGTGKSNLLNFMISYDLALYNSRFFIIEAGGSFDNLITYYKSFGISVNKIKIDPKNPISLNPFANGLKIIDQLETLNGFKKEEIIIKECDKQIKECK